MSALVILFIFVPILVAILLVLNVLLAAHRPDSEKVTPYECGFSPVYGQTRAPFSIQYYLVGVLFMVFDLEILLIYPYAVTAYEVGAYGYIIAMLFFSVLTLGFVYEISTGVLYITDQRSSIHPPVTSSTTSNSPNDVNSGSPSSPEEKTSREEAKARRIKDARDRRMRKATRNIHTSAVARRKVVLYAVILGLPQAAFDIAHAHIQNGAPTTVHVLNSILANFGWSITQEEFDTLVALPKVVVPLPLNASKIIGRDLSSNHADYKDNRFSGIYLFSHEGQLYVGSSIYLGRRIRQYFRPSVTSREQRPVIKA